VHEIDTRTDVFALGAITWELLAGRPAFESPSFSTALYRVSFVDPPDIHTLRPDVPPAVSLVLRHALAKSREHRTPSVDAFHRELQGGARGVEPADIPPPAPVGPDGRLMSIVPGAAPAPQSMTPAPQSSTPAPPPSTPHSMTPSPQSTPAPFPPTAASAPPRRRRRLLAVAIAMAAAAAAGFAVVIMLQPDQPAAPSVPPTTAAPAQPSGEAAPAPDPSPAPAPESQLDVSLTVRVSPASARPAIRVGGAPIHGQTTRVPRGERVEVVIEAPGYLPHREHVSPEADLVLAITLQKRRPRRTAPPAAKPTEPPAGPATVEPTPSAPRAPAATPAPRPTPKPRATTAPPAPEPKKKRKTGTVFDD
jgi:serine/threonine-protein kinase